MKKIYSVQAINDDMRIDRWIRNNIGNIPQSLIEKNLRNGKIKLNKKKIKSSYKVKESDEIELHNLNINNEIKQKKIKFKPSNQLIKENESLIIDDNEDFVVLNKKSGISVQGGTKSKKNLIDIFSKSQFFGNAKPFSVHRLDKDTSGVFIMAKHRKSAQLMTSLFRLRKVYKTYIAACHGELQNISGELKNDLIKYEKGKAIKENALSYYKVLDKNAMCTLLEMNPVTGKKHQLRKQLFNIGHPIIGDQKYKFINHKGTNKNLMLHSYKIKFMINKKKFTYTASLPEYFKKFLKSKRLKFSD